MTDFLANDGAAIAARQRELAAEREQAARDTNVAEAQGSLLDHIGKVWHVLRLEGETDYAYRQRLMNVL